MLTAEVWYCGTHGCPVVIAQPWMAGSIRGVGPTHACPGCGSYNWRTIGD